MAHNNLNFLIDTGVVRRPRLFLGTGHLGSLLKIVGKCVRSQESLEGRRTTRL